MRDIGKGVLVGVETPGIQSYIFRSNHLRENVGASHLVVQATDHWVKQAVRAAAHSSNVSTDGVTLSDAQGMDAEVLYAGGGNSVIWFRTPEIAQQFTRELSTHVLIDAPGLPITVAHQDFESDFSLSRAIESLLRAFKPARSDIPRFSPLAGLGVTAACQSTGFPAVAYREVAQNESRYVSAEVKAKLDNFQDADKALRDTLKLRKGYTYPQDLDKLGREEGESSYIAVVHADGNRIGALIRGIGKVFPDPSQNSDYLKTLYTFSEGIKTMTENVMQRLVDLLMTAVHYDHELDADVIGATDRHPKIVLEHDSHTHDIILPFRPLVTGGDDVTFLCDGRIGLSLAITFLRFFEEESRYVLADLNRDMPDSNLPDPLTACAGIAIVKSHYPFARAYELAEELCASAKKFKRQQQLLGSALDWHLTPGGLYGEIEDMRKREYRIETKQEISNLLLRPVSLANEHPLRNWPLIERLLDEFFYSWSGKRNKAKALRDALRGGPASVSLFANRFEQALPQVDGFVDGWSEPVQGETSGQSEKIQHYCCYDDALELMDLYVPLTLETVR